MRKLTVVSKGYHDINGGIFVTQGRMPPDVPLKEAARAIARVFEDTAFLTECDMARAWANAVTIPLKLGGILKASTPIQYAGASEPGSGKSYMQDVTAALSSETPYVVTVKSRGVGGVEESAAQGMINGRAIIKVDNIVGEFDSQYFAAAVTSDRITARVPYAREVEVEPGHHIFMINSNGSIFSPDLTRRLSIVRIKKRPIKYDYISYKEGGVLAHVRANQSYYLGCLFSVIRAWVDAGKPRTYERRHSFTLWAQTLDWIVQNIFESRVGLFDDYDYKGHPRPQPPSSDDSCDDFLTWSGSATDPATDC